MFMTAMQTPRVRLEPWPRNGLDLLRRCNTPEMTEHLGGPETEQQLVVRHERYLALHGKGQMFQVVLLPDGDVVGSVGYWEHVWHDEPTYETGYAIFPEFQGRGLAVAAALALVEHAKAHGTHRYVHAFPSLEHTASNAVCRKAGFELYEECEFEYPKGHWLRSNDWRMDLKHESDA